MPTRNHKSRRLARAFAWAALAAVTALTAMPAHAHPVTFPGNLMTMIEADRNWTDFNAWYTFAPSHALGGGYSGFRNDDINRVRRIPNLHYNYRVARWNLPDAQANIYLQQGIGSASGADFSGRRWTYMPGAQADYETRKVFVKYAWHGYKSNTFTHNFHNAQAGAAFVVGDYEENSHWAILDWRKTTNLGTRDEWTPTYRLINKDVFFEFGLVNGRTSNPRITLMLNF